MWLDHHSVSINASSYQKYNNLIKNHLMHGIGDLPLNRITGSEINRFVKEKTTGHNALSVKTVNDLLAIINMVYSFAEEEYKIPKPTIRRIKEQKKEMRVLSRQEQAILENYLLQNTDLYKLGVLLSLYTGIRVGELCALSWEDIENGVLTINKTMHRITKGSTSVVEITSPKTTSSFRTIPLPSKVNTIVESHRSTGNVIKNKNGEIVEPRLMQIHFKKILTCCKLSDTNFHALRHTFATRCVELGFDAKLLSEILGHSDVKTTLNQYVHASFEHKCQNMEKLYF